MKNNTTATAYESRHQPYSEKVNRAPSNAARIEIITGKIDHAPAIAYIGRTAFRKAFALLFNSCADLEEYLDYTYSVDKLASSLRKENNVYFLATVDGLPVGFAKVKRHSLNDQLDSVFQAELQKLYVLKEYQGSGVGQALMNTVARFVSSFEPDCLWLDTYVGNERAIRFYERNGFQKAGTHQFTIGSQTFEYFLMALPITINQTCQ